MLNGVVKMWHVEKGYGFISTTNNDDLFVHKSDLHSSVKGNRLFEGQKVKFEIKSDMKGDKAVNVRVISNY